MNEKRFGRSTSKGMVESVAYGALAFLCSLIIANDLQVHGSPIFFFILPSACLLLLVSRWNIFEALIPAVLFAGIGLTGLMGQDMVGMSSHSRLGMAALIMLAAISRFQAASRKKERLSATARLNFTPIPSNIPRAKSTFHATKIATLPLILFAWLAASFACRQWTEITTNPRAYQAYFDQLRANIGLDVPAVFIGMKLLFSLVLILWILRGLFSYFCLARHDESLAAMHLRNELWRWNGSEQRMISKQLRKNQT